MKYLLFSVVFFTFIGFGQNIGVSEKVIFKKSGSQVAVVGETDKFIYVEKFRYDSGSNSSDPSINRSGSYGKTSIIYKFDKNLKLISQTDYKTLHDNVKKDLYVFGENIIAFYTLKVGKRAIIYYDVIDAESLELKSEDNVLYEYKYRQFVNASLIDTRILIDDSNDYIFINLYIHELISPVKEGGNFGYFLKLDKNFNEVYSLKYDDLRKERSTSSSKVLKNGDFAFVNYNQEEISIYTINESSGLTNQTYKLDGFFIAECKLIETKKGLLFSGLYSNSNLYTSDNHFFQGIFYTKLGSNGIIKVPFSEYKSKGIFESDFHKISHKYSEYIGVEIAFNEDNNSLIVLVFNKVLNFDKIIISKINLTDEIVDFNVVKITKDHTKGLVDLVFVEGDMKLLFHENTLKIRLMPDYNTKAKDNGTNTWESLTVSLNNISETTWSKKSEKKGMTSTGKHSLNTILVYGDTEYFKLIGINY